MDAAFRLFAFDQAVGGYNSYWNTNRDAPSSSPISRALLRFQQRVGATAIVPYLWVAIPSRAKEASDAVVFRRARERCQEAFEASGSDARAESIAKAEGVGAQLGVAVVGGAFDEAFERLADASGSASMRTIAEGHWVADAIEMGFDGVFELIESLPPQALADLECIAEVGYWMNRLGRPLRSGSRPERDRLFGEKCGLPIILGIEAIDQLDGDRLAWVKALHLACRARNLPILTIGSAADAIAGLKVARAAGFEAMHSPSERPERSTWTIEELRAEVEHLIDAAITIEEPPPDVTARIYTLQDEIIDRLGGSQDSTLLEAFGMLMFTTLLQLSPPVENAYRTATRFEGYAATASSAVPGYTSAFATTELCSGAEVHSFCFSLKDRRDNLQILDGGLYDNIGYKTALEVALAERERIARGPATVIIIDSADGVDFQTMASKDRESGHVAAIAMASSFPNQNATFDRLRDPSFEAAGFDARLLLDFSSASGFDPSKHAFMLRDLPELAYYAAHDVGCWADDGSWHKGVRVLKRPASFGDPQSNLSALEGKGRDCVSMNFARAGYLYKTTFKYDLYRFRLNYQLGRLVVRMKRSDIAAAVFRTARNGER
jgi:hypothetical protein